MTFHRLFTQDHESTADSLMREGITEELSKLRLKLLNSGNESTSDTREERLVIEATILPDNPEWRPVDMPVFLSSEDPGPLDFVGDRGTSTYGFQIEVSHVTIRGLKF